MGFTLFNLFKVGLLLTNSLMILNRRRFLEKVIGINTNNHIPGSTHGMDGKNPLFIQAIGLFHAVHYLKVPVIICNIIIIFFEIILGGT